jgi:tetratricopeptide (TPR) repeat protein
MGVVYRAEQDNPRRLVALKVVRSALASETMIRRFEQEAQMLGRLKHPGIAQIYHAGTADTGFGPQPFFAMEFVQGCGLREYIEQRRLSIRQRLELLAKVCDAVQHAHQKGVIHRDLKPVNILVDESGQPKILDFGVGRIIDARDADTMRTMPGQLMGTLSYMSPEQVQGRVEDVDTRADVYSMGVILYEVLSGQLPHDLQNRSIAQCISVISEGRIVPLGRRNSALRGDVESIVAKTLEQDKSQRYQSSAELAADIRRYLAHQPVLARPQTALYTIGKFCRRNRVAVSAAALLMIAGLLIGLQTWRQVGATRRANANAQLYIRELQESLNVNEGDFLTPREDLDKLEEYVEFASSNLENQPALAAQLFELIGLNYMLADEYDQAERNIGQSLGLRQTVTGISDAEVGSGLFSMGRVKWHQGDLQAAEDYLQQALQAQTIGLGPQHKDIARTLQILASTLRDQGRFDEAIDLAQSALEMRLNLLPHDDDDVMASYNNIASIHEAMGEFADAAARYEQVLALIEPKFGPDTPRVARTKRRLASCLIKLGELQAAESLLTEAIQTQIRHLGADHSEVAASHCQFARLALAHATSDSTATDQWIHEAQQHGAAAHEIHQAKFGPSHRETQKSGELLEEIENAKRSLSKSTGQR